MEQLQAQYQSKHPVVCAFLVDYFNCLDQVNGQLPTLIKSVQSSAELGQLAENLSKSLNLDLVKYIIKFINFNNYMSNSASFLRDDDLKLFVQKMTALHQVIQVLTNYIDFKNIQFYLPLIYIIPSIRNIVLALQNFCLQAIEQEKITPTQSLHLISYIKMQYILNPSLFLTSRLINPIQQQQISEPNSNSALTSDKALEASLI